MRVKFLREVDVDLNAIPNVCWGRIQKKPITSAQPSIVPGSAEFSMPSAGAEMQHVFPAGAIVELPNELAAKYLADGDAEANVSPNGPRIASDKKDGIL